MKTQPDTDHATTETNAEDHVQDSVDSTSPDFEQTTQPPFQHAQFATAAWAVESFGVGLWELDVATFALNLSARAGELLGIAPRQSDCDTLVAVMHPDDRAMIPAAIARAVDPASDGQFQVDFRVVAIDGHVRWIDARAHREVAHTQDGLDVVILRGAMLDITARKQIEDRSAQSETHLRVATEAALFFSWEIDIAANIYQSSRNTRDVVGFELPATLTAVWNMIHPDDRPAFGAALDMAASSLESFTIDFRLLHPRSGIATWLCTSGVALPGAAAINTRIVGVTQNITERKQAELALRESEERYRTLFSSITEGFYIIEKIDTPPGAPADYRFVEGNPTFEAYANGRSVAGHTVRELFPDAMEALYDTFDQIIETGTALHIHAGYVYKDWVFDVNASRIDDHTHRRVGVLLIDITERRTTELLREAALQATEQARQAAEAAINTRDQFMTIASHELRTPLTSLLGYARMLESGMITRPEMMPHVARLMTRQAQRLDTLVGQMLDTSRLQRGQFAIDAVPMFLDLLVRQVIDEFRLTLSTSTRHRLVLHTWNEPLWIMGDADRLVQVFENLLANAVKYSPAGSSLDVVVERDATTAIVAVIDHGIGIAPNAQSHIFEAFYRAENAGEIASGFGLGLHVSQQIVTRHGGRIEIESTLGEGSTFRVILPLLDATWPI